MNYALVKNSAVAIASTDLGVLSRYIFENDDVSVSLPADPGGISVAGYDIMPVNVISEEIPAGSAGTGQFTFTVNGDVVERREAYAAMTSDQVIAEITAAVQKHLDDTARTRNYDGILSLCSYATSTSTKFGPEGLAGVEWRDSVWETCYAILAAVQSGSRTVPTVGEVIAELPAMAWPA